jgi:hypothetical protein
MVGVRIEIRRYVDAAQPGWVECSLTDAKGKEWLFIEKVPVVTTEDLDTASRYPCPGVIACEVLERRDKGVVVISTVRPWHIKATGSETQFEVRQEQLEEFECDGTESPEQGDS